MTEQRITSRKNPLLQQVKKLFSSRRERESAGLFAADGTKLLEEAMKYCPGLHTVILSDEIQLDLPERVRLVRGCDGVHLSHGFPPGCGVPVSSAGKNPLLP